MAMDLMGLGLGVAGMGMKGAQWAMNRKSQKKMNAFQKAGLSFQRDSAHRNLAQLLEDIPRNRRRLEGSLAERGIGDSSIANQNLGYYDRSSDRQMGEAQGGVAMAEKQLSSFKKAVKHQRRSGYLDLGLNLLGGVGNAAMSMNNATPAAYPGMNLSDDQWAALQMYLNR